MGWLMGALFKYGIGLIKEDGEQMPGVFFLKDRKLERALCHRTIADQPDYLLVMLVKFRADVVFYPGKPLPHLLFLCA